MHARPEVFAEIAAALKSRRWVARADADGIAYTLDEAVEGGVIQVRLRFDPKRMWVPPLASLKTVSGTPKGFVLHRYWWGFCYLDFQSIEWNPEAPEFISHVVWAAERAIAELHRLQRGEKIFEADSEFVVHWSGIPAYLDIIGADWPPRAGAKLERLDYSRPEFPNSTPLTVYRLKGGSLPDRYKSFEQVAVQPLVPVVVGNLNDYPFAAAKAWPPKALADLNPWLLAHDPVEQKALWRSIADAMHADRSRPSNVLLLLDTKAGRFGALLVVNKEILKKFRSGLPLAEQLHGINNLTRSITVQRVTFERLDDDFVLARNAPETRAVLAGKNIHLLGAGAVGGQLADMLVQAGAGTGDGELHIFDPQIYRSENSGRHLLGVPALGMYKAEALKQHLKRQRLAGNVFAHTQYAGDVNLHQKADLVIDATASPYLGSVLSNAARRERQWALLSAFVEGEGWVAGAYLYRGVPGDACRDCLEPWVGGKGSHIREAHQNRPRDNGCGGSYTPYRAAAAAIASAMACELACDWAIGKATDRYRTFRLPSAPSHVARGRTSSPASRSGCICSRALVP